MGKFCENCGKKLEENQDVCLGCGKFLKKVQEPIKKSSYTGYRITAGIILIIIGFFVTFAFLFANFMPALGIAGIIAIASGILTLCSRNNKVLYLISGILLIIGSIINFISIKDISIYAVCCVSFGVVNIVLSAKK